MQAANEEAEKILEEDPSLSGETYRKIGEKLISYMKNDMENLNI